MGLASMSSPVSHSGKWKQKCTCPKALFSEIHLPGQVLKSVPGCLISAVLLELVLDVVNERPYG